MAGDDLRAALLHRLEQIVVGDQAQALIPRIVGRGEAGAVVIRAQRLFDPLVKELLHLFRLGARALEAEMLERDVLPARDAIGELFGQHLAQEIRDPVLRRAAEHPGRRALEHGDLGRAAFALRHGRHQRDGGCARSDHDHLFAGVIEIVGPELGMHHAPFEGAQIEARIVGFVVIVIARSEIEPVGGQTLAVALGGFDRNVPAGIGFAPVRGKDGVARADVLADATLVHDAVEIIEDGGPVGDRFFVLPRFEIEAQRMHVAIRTDAGIAEQIPCPAQIGAPLKDRIAVMRRLFLHMGGHPDAGYARPHDQDVVIGRSGAACHVGFSQCCEGSNALRMVAPARCSVQPMRIAGQACVAPPSASSPFWAPSPRLPRRMGGWARASRRAMTRFP